MEPLLVFFFFSLPIFPPVLWWLRTPKAMAGRMQAKYRDKDVATTLCTDLGVDHPSVKSER